MAKLSARGRTEVARWSKEYEIADPSRAASWGRTEYALMSDGALLRKFTVRMREGGDLHNYGWVVASKKTTLAKVSALELVGYTRSK